MLGLVGFLGQTDDHRPVASIFHGAAALRNCTAGGAHATLAGQKNWLSTTASLSPHGHPSIASISSAVSPTSTYCLSWLAGSSISLLWYRAQFGCAAPFSKTQVDTSRKAGREQLADAVGRLALRERQIGSPLQPAL